MHVRVLNTHAKLATMLNMLLTWDFATMLNMLLTWDFFEHTCLSTCSTFY